MDERKKTTIQLLIVDDDTAFRRVLIKELSRHGFATDGAANGEEALQLLEHHSYHVVLLDMRMPGMDGMEALTQIKRISPSTEIILLTAFATLGEAVESTKRGAFHYLMKPAQLDEMESLIHRAYEKGRLEAQNLALREQIERGKQFVDLIGESPKFLEIKAMIKRVGPTEATVLLQGESGVGKELVAGAIHASSNRHQEPFIIVDCNTFQETLVESELFGHMKGAFTGALERRTGRFELADGGTLFLDEVSELPPDTQVKLLRVLQEHEFEPLGSSRTIKVNVRIIAASNRDLEKAEQEGRFRADLYYRLNVLPIVLPPLRQRRSDIPLLTTFFVEKFARQFGKQITGIAQDTMDLLSRYDWPGNIRELQNVVERAVVLSRGPVLKLGADLLPASAAVGSTDEVACLGVDHLQSHDSTGDSPSLAQVERRHIQSVLQKTDWVIEGERGAAKILDLHPNTLRSRMKKLGIERASVNPTVPATKSRSHEAITN